MRAAAFRFSQPLLLPLMSTVLALLLIAPAQAQQEYTLAVKLSTALGDIEVELYPDRAPITVANFLSYADAGYYDGAQFYRVVRMDNQPDSPVKIQVIQGGLGVASYEDDRAPEFPPIAHETTQQTGLRHIDGTVSMARLAPGSATSEFFICIGAQPSLDFGGDRNPDGQGFAAFGQVTAGMDVVRAIQQRSAEAEVPDERAAIRGQVLDEPVIIELVERL
jgi:peptidyl-prolyl cis-trans isomerase A (cyclophilin A)